MKVLFLSLFFMLGAVQSANAGADCKCSCVDAVASGQQQTEYTVVMFNRMGGCSGMSNFNSNRDSATNQCKNICKNSTDSPLRSNAAQACAVAAKPGDWWIVSRAKANGTTWNSGWQDSGKPNKLVHCNSKCPDGQELKGGMCLTVAANVQGAKNGKFGPYSIWDNGLYLDNSGPIKKTCPAGQWVNPDGYCHRGVIDANAIKNVTGNGSKLKNADLGAGYYTWDGTLFYKGSPAVLGCDNGGWPNANKTNCSNGANPANVPGFPNLPLLGNNGLFGVAEGGKIYKRIGNPVLDPKF